MIKITTISRGDRLVNSDSAIGVSRKSVDCEAPGKSMDGDPVTPGLVGDDSCRQQQDEDYNDSIQHAFLSEQSVTT